jgi:hypothetical protein
MAGMADTAMAKAAAARRVGLRAFVMFFPAFVDWSLNDMTKHCAPRRPADGRAFRWDEMQLAGMDGGYMY